MTIIERLAAKIAHWRAEAAVLRSYGDERGTTICEKHAEEVEAELRAAEDEVLTLDEAAGESGYSPDHLGRLVRDGKIPNAGRRRVPRIRRGDVPRKAGALLNDVTRRTLRGEGKEQIALSVVTSFRRGNDR